MLCGGDGLDKSWFLEDMVRVESITATAVGDELGVDVVPS